MIKLLEFLWHGCWHDWKHEDNSKIVDDERHQIGIAFWYRCEKCGRFKVSKRTF